MSRKIRNNNTSSNNNNSDEPQRFLQLQPVSDATTNTPVAFSVGATDANATPLLKPKPTSMWSRLFGSNKKERKEPAAAASPHRQSLWQRSKSIMRPRSNLDRSKSVFIDLPHLKIVGSGSAAQLLNYEDKFEYSIDLYGMLNHIFEENDAYYCAGRCFDPQTAAAATDCDYTQKAQINDDGLLSPTSTITEEQGGFPVPAGFGCESLVHAAFNDNPKLDSPLLPDDCVDNFQDCSVSESLSSLSMPSAIRSFISGEFSLESARSYSTDEVAEMFGLMTVDDCPPQILPDGSVRCLVEGERGSIESIRFRNCWKPQQFQSEDQLNMNRIQTNEELQPKQLNLKQRCQSLAHFSKISEKDLSTDAAASRRRSFGAKVSQIVAMYENVALRSSK